MSVRALVRAILHLNGIQGPDGRPLYGYRLDSSALGRVRRELNACLHALDPFERTHSALVCLYAAENFSRVYETGPWSWDVAFSGLESRGQPFRLEPSRRAILVERGLQYWGRSVLSLEGTNRYLATLICEGGLPRALLRRDEAHITRFLRRGLSLRESAMRTATEDLLRGEAHLLPAQLQNDVWIETCARLVEQVVDARRRLGNLDGDLVQRLEAEHPNWRRLMPLRIEDDENAKRLLEGLIRQDAEADTAAPALRIRTELDLGNDEPSPRRVLQVAREVELERLISLFEGLEPPDFFTIRGRIGDQHELPVAYVTRLPSKGGPRFRMDPQRSSLPAEALGSRVEWVMSEQGEERARVEAANCEPLDDVPWVFAPRADGTWVLHGQGNARLRGEEAWVALPLDATWQCDPGVVQEERRGQDRTWVRITGRADFDVDGATTTVTTRSAEDLRTTCSILGERAVHHALGARAFFGSPTEVLIHSGERRTRRSVQFEFRADGGPRGRWVPWTDDDLGFGIVRWVEQGELRVRRRVLCLPLDFEVRAVGRALELRSTKLRAVDVMGPGFDIRSAEDGFRIEPTAGCEARETEVPVRLDFGQNRTATLSFRDPGLEAVFVDASGRVLAQQAHLSWEQVPGVRARLSDDMTRKGYVHYLVIHSPDKRAKLERKIPSPSGEISLDAVSGVIHAFLAESLDRHDAVEARIDVRPPRRLSIRRHRNGLRPERDDAGNFTLHPVPEQRVDFDLEVRPIDDWGSDPLILSPTAEGTWSYPLERQIPGTALLSAAEPKRRHFRALAVFSGEAPECSDDLQRLCAEDLTAPARVQRLAGFWRELVEAEEERPEVERLQAMLLSLGELPANTFQPVVALATVPEAAVWMLMRVGKAGFDTVWDGLERLSFAWWAVPLRAWRSGARKYALELNRQLAHAGLDEGTRNQLLREMVRGQMDRIAVRWPGGEAVHDALAKARTPGLPDGDLPDCELEVVQSPAGRAAFQSWLVEDAKAVRRRQAAQHWPSWPTDGAPPLSGPVRTLLGQAKVPNRDFEVPVLAAPMVAAELVMARQRMPDPAQLRALRVMRAFDPVWFDAAQAYCLALFFDPCWE